MPTSVHPTTPAPILRADARRNRARLLDVAHQAFLAHGVGASMDEIARQAGVGIGTLYRHFPTRDDLIVELAAADLERLAVAADDAGAEPAAVERWLESLVEHNLTYRGLADSIVAARGRPTALGAACDRIHAAGEAMVARAQGRGDLRDDVRPGDVIDLAVAVAWVTEGDADDRRRRDLLRVALDGLRAGR